MLKIIGMMLLVVINYGKLVTLNSIQTPVTGLRKTPALLQYLYKLLISSSIEALSLPSDIASKLIELAGISFISATSFMVCLDNNRPPNIKGLPRYTVTAYKG